MLLGGDVAVRLDANGAWDVDTAVRSLAVLGHYDLQYVEQPCRTLDELVALRARLDEAGIGVALAVDEGIRRADDPYAVAATGAVDVAVVKVAPLGGVRRTLAIAAELARYEVDLVVSSALDTSVGISAGIAAAAAMPVVGEQLACGLGTIGLLASDVVTEPLVPVDGRLAVGRVEPDPDLLAALAAAPERQRWWRERVRRCHEVLQDRWSVLPTGAA
jgi:O-succinylbenzoate synthase